MLFGSGAAEPETAAAPTEKTYPLLRYTPPRRSGAISFTAEDAALVDIRNAPEAEFDAGELITRPLKFDANADGPLILIVHTHATEAYTPTAEDDYERPGNTTRRTRRTASCRWGRCWPTGSVPAASQRSTTIH